MDQKTVMGHSSSAIEKSVSLAEGTKFDLGNEVLWLLTLLRMVTVGLQHSVRRLGKRYQDEALRPMKKGLKSSVSFGIWLENST